jgi:hypothetical protein
VWGPFNRARSIGVTESGRTYQYGQGNQLPDEALVEAVTLRAQHPSIQAAAAAAGLPRKTLADRLKVAARRGLMGYTPVLPGFAVSKTTSEIDEDGEVRRQFVTQKPEPGPEFSVPEGHVVKGVSALIDSDGRITQQWIKTREDGSYSPEFIIEQIRAALAEYEGLSSPASAPLHIEDDLATIYGVADLHVGLLSWGDETGYNYDIKIAEKVLQDAFGRLIATAPHAKQAVILGLGDLLHSDGYDNMTARSKAPLDVDGRYPRVLQSAVQILIFMIDQALTKHESVLVRVLPGNHDDHSAIAVALALSMFYNNNPRVTVDADPGRFWWWSWGSVFLGATHGDRAKMRDLPLIMATRNAEAWGRSKFRHIYTGHIHTQTGIEMNGVTVESFQTPVAPDAWHVAEGYGAGRSVTAITHHRERGEICRQKVNIL